MKRPPGRPSAKPPKRPSVPKPPPRKVKPTRTALFQSVVDGIADPMVVYDRDWCVIFENAAAVQVFKAIGVGSMLGKVLWEVYPDLKGTAFEREMRRAMEERVPTSFVELRKQRGVWTEARCYPLPNGGISVVWHNVTEQKRAEQALRYLARASDILNASLDYQETLNALANLIVPELADWCSVSLVINDEIRIVAVAHVDPERVRLVRELDARSPRSVSARTRTAQVIRSGKPDLVPEITDEMLDQAIEDPEYRALVKRLGFNSVLTVPLTFGDRTLGAMSLVSVRSQSGRAFTQADVALAQELAWRAATAVEHARLYEDALESKVVAEEANAIKASFLARMSHELRTPLNAIGGYVELLSLGLRGPVTDQQRNDLDRIKRSQHHLLSLINDVLNYAKVEAGRLKYEIRRIPLAETLAAVEALFASQFAERKLNFSVDLSDPQLCVRADPERLQQILFNLVSNAIKFTSAGGSITIRVRPVGEAIEIAVLDTGVGIPGDKLEAIFEPFVQLAREGEVPQGTGLGLAISRDLARAMDGELTAASIGAGATFTLRLKRG
jgi:signal transduction histidine kinase